jgi:type I restriction enzyme S subunit
MLENDFLFNFLRTSGYRQHLNLHAHGTANQASLNLRDMLDVYIALPPVGEQREISAFLDRELAKMDALVRMATHATNVLQELGVAIIATAVTGQMDISTYRPQEAAAACL